MSGCVDVRGQHSAPESGALGSGAGSLAVPTAMSLHLRLTWAPCSRTGSPLCLLPSTPECPLFPGLSATDGHSLVSVPSPNPPKAPQRGGSLPSPPAAPLPLTHPYGCRVRPSGFCKAGTSVPYVCGGSTRDPGFGELGSSRADPERGVPTGRMLPTEGPAQHTLHGRGRFLNGCLVGVTGLRASGQTRHGSKRVPSALPLSDPAAHRALSPQLCRPFGGAKAKVVYLHLRQTLETLRPILPGSPSPTGPGPLGQSPPLT